MKTAIYLANKSVAILCGEQLNRLTHAYHFTLNEDCIINGIITNSSSLKNQLGQFMDKHSISKDSVCLVIDSSQIVVRQLELPSLKEKELAPVIKNEMFDLQNNGENYVIDYSYLGEKNGKNNYLVCAMPEELVHAYMSLFSEMGIHLQSIDSSVHAFNRWVDKMGFFKDQTNAVKILDGNSLMSVLYENGHYIFSSHNRFYTEKGTDAFAREIVAKNDDFSRLLSAQKSQYTLQNDVYFGFDESDYENCKKLVNEPLHATTLEPSAYGVNTDLVCTDESGQKASSDDYVYLFSAFIQSAKKEHVVNYVQRLNEAKVDSQPKSHFFKENRSAVVLVLVTAFLSVCAFGYNMVKKAENSALNTRLEQLEEPYNEAYALKEENDLLLREIADIESLEENLNSYPCASAPVIRQMESLMPGNVDVEITAYDSKSGVLSFDAYCKNNDDVHTFINKLVTSNLFQNVTYSGYTYVDNASAYIVHVQCILTNEAGRGY